MNAGQTPTPAEGAARMDNLDRDARRDLITAVAWPASVVVAVAVLVVGSALAAGWRP